MIFGIFGHKLEAGCWSIDDNNLTANGWVRTARVGQIHKSLDNIGSFSTEKNPQDKKRSVCAV